MLSTLSRFIICLIALILTACDVSVSADGIEDMDATQIDENLEPLSTDQYEFAQQVVRLFYAERTDDLIGLLHNNVTEDLDADAISNLYRFKSDTVETMDYYGHGYGQDVGLELTVVQFKLPRENGYDLMRVTLSSDPECCQLAGLFVEKKFVKTLFGD